MYYTLKASESINATIKLPASKSISNRALIINQLAGGKIALKNLSDCDDTEVMLKALKETEELIDIHAAGTAMRFLTAYFSATNNHTVLTGTDRMKHRPIKILVDALRSIGATIRYQQEEGFPPLVISGHKLSGGEITLPGNVSSQYISALMMVAPTMENGLLLKITGDLISSSYIKLTANLMKRFGAEIDFVNERTIKIAHGKYKGGDFEVENDWSGASYWYEIIALCPDAKASVILPGLYKASMQGDSKVASLFKPLGVETEYTDKGVILKKGEGHTDIYEADLTNQPDLAQTLVVTCAMMGTPFKITGLQTLRIKETDRLKALCEELEKLGIKLKEKHGDTLLWDGKKGKALERPVIETYEDHRMAMAFAPCCIKIKSLRINNPKVVSKSYPNFWKDFVHAGFEIMDL